ncbi:MAG: tRNA (adenosine(37)-N6)-threonylcarbamoyltransferase complex ATPase subunit type 1 TsaE [candidate division Zixibacteria bacterium]|nr:tRNA (adenosine(37)-N6)-threonylcarbamoyltransferase complex ATPase subunit type 1 TsaE [candidate division Zixibacteria bacterium]MCK4606024.1 tRNA (adenosine(37)-N6)-threonylcarbamoyltransferase complex ATPase subunit type 1 TsaE [candidate division Zixibacteria bacterium]
MSTVSHSEDQTIGLAKNLVGLLRPGDVIVLRGGLGSGKTVFVRGLAIALGLDERQVNSPSFTIVNEYPGERPLYHFDLYRISDPSELYEVGWDEYLERNGLVAVEWGEKARGMLPTGYYLVDFGIVDEQKRTIDITFVNE